MEVTDDTPLWMSEYDASRQKTIYPGSGTPLPRRKMATISGSCGWRTERTIELIGSSENEGAKDGCSTASTLRKMTEVSMAGSI
jgi:hypothetical protein